MEVVLLVYKLIMSAVVVLFLPESLAQVCLGERAWGAVLFLVTGSCPALCLSPPSASADD